MLPNVKKAVEHPEMFQRLTAQLVVNNPNIVGAGVAFRPRYYADRGTSCRLSVC